MIKQCVICGEIFEVFGRYAKRLVCSTDCQRIRNQEYIKAYIVEKKIKDKALKGNKELDKKIEEANSRGLSYGQLQAMKYMEEINARG